MEAKENTRKLIMLLNRFGCLLKTKGRRQRKRQRSVAHCEQEQRSLSVGKIGWVITRDEEDKNIFARTVAVLTDKFISVTPDADFLVMSSPLQLQPQPPSAEPAVALELEQHVVNAQYSTHKQHNEKEQYNTMRCKQQSLFCILMNYYI